jgi:hypothetical protein
MGFTTGGDTQGLRWELVSKTECIQRLIPGAPPRGDPPPLSYKLPVFYFTTLPNSVLSGRGCVIPPRWSIWWVDRSISRSITEPHAPTLAHTAYGDISLTSTQDHWTFGFKRREAQTTLYCGGEEVNWNRKGEFQACGTPAIAGCSLSKGVYL